MIEVTFLLPLSSNEGELFTPFFHQRAMDTLSARFGGVTFGERVSGVWYDGSRSIRDELFMAVVGVDNLLTHGQALVAAAEALAKHYRQHAIAVHYLGHMEIILAKRSETTLAPVAA